MSTAASSADRDATWQRQIVVCLTLTLAQFSVSFADSFESSFISLGCSAEEMEAFSIVESLAGYCGLFLYAWYGVSSMLGQAVGRRDVAALHRGVSRSLKLALVLGLCVAAIVTGSAQPLVELYSPSSPAVAAVARRYLYAHFSGLPAMFLTHCFVCQLEGLQHTAPAAAVLGTTAVVTVAANYLVIYGTSENYGVVGSGVASAVRNTMTAGLGGSLVRILARQSKVLSARLHMPVGSLSSSVSSPHPLPKAAHVLPPPGAQFETQSWRVFLRGIAFLVLQGAVVKTPSWLFAIGCTHIPGAGSDRSTSDARILLQRVLSYPTQAAVAAMTAANLLGSKYLGSEDRGSYTALLNRLLAFSTVLGVLGASLYQMAGAPLLFEWFTHHAEVRALLVRSSIIMAPAIFFTLLTGVLEGLLLADMRFAGVALASLMSLGLVFSPLFAVAWMWRPSLNMFLIALVSFNAARSSLMLFLLWRGSAWRRPRCHIVAGDRDPDLNTVTATAVRDATIETPLLQA